MSRGAKHSSLNQTLNEIDSFLDIQIYKSDRIDGWIYLSIHIYY